MKNAEAVFTVEAIRSALATIPDYLDRSMDMVDIYNHSGDGFDFVVEQLLSSCRHEQRKKVLLEERTENAKKHQELVDKIEALAKLCLAQEKKFSKLRPYLILLKQEAQKELDTHRDILLYETLTRIVRAFNDIIMDTKRPSGNRQVLTERDKKSLKANGLNFITSIMQHTLGSDHRKAQLANKALQCLTDGEKELVSGVQAMVNTVKLQKHSTQHPRPSRSYSISLLQDLQDPQFNIDAAIQFITTNPTSPLIADEDKFFFADVDDPIKTTLEARIEYLQQYLDAEDDESE